MTNNCLQVCNIHVNASICITEGCLTTFQGPVHAHVFSEVQVRKGHILNIITCGQLTDQPYTIMMLHRAPRGRLSQWSPRPSCTGETQTIWNGHDVASVCNNAVSQNESLHWLLALGTSNKQMSGIITAAIFVYICPEMYMYFVMCILFNPFVMLELNLLKVICIKYNVKKNTFVFNCFKVNMPGYLKIW